MKRRILKLSLSVIVLMSLCRNASAQPYHHNIDTLWDPDKPEAEQTRDYRLYRVNLRTGSVDTILSHAGTIQNIYVNNDQSRFFVEYEGTLHVKDALRSRPIVSLRFPLTYIITALLDAPKVNRIFVTLGKNTYLDVGGPEDYTLILDRATYTVIDSSTEFLLGFNPSGNPPNQFFSRNGLFLCSLTYEKSGIFFEISDASTGKVVSQKRCGQIGGFILGQSFRDGKNGYAVVGFKNASGFENQQYAFCDVDGEVVTYVLSFPWRSEPRLSANGKRVFIEEVPLSGDVEYRTGRYYVFDTENGKLLQRLDLPPGGTFFIFDHYPDEAFYYLKEQNRSVVINVNEVTPTEALLDTLLSLKHQASADGWLADKNFVKELDNHLENAQKHLAKGDSANARKEIEKFQEKVKKEYEKTVDSEKKNKPRDKRFVSVDGWKLLYFNAGYILDRLPSEKKGKKR